MIVLSHRGYWKNIKEKNSKTAFERSFDMGLGTETDLRDANSKIVISHDMPQGKEMSFEKLLQIMNGRNLTLALNIKADGLADEVIKLLQTYNHTDYFTFDMSVPDMVIQIKKGLKVFTGLSDILPNPTMLDDAKGVWLDCFNSDWYSADTVDNLINQDKKVCIVSADLHGRDTAKQWQIIKNCKSISKDTLMICTDKPTEAKAYFGGQYDN